MGNYTDCTGKNHKTVKGTILRNSEETQLKKYLPVTKAFIFYKTEISHTNMKMEDSLVNR